MDINFLRGIATILAMLAFAGVVWWAYGQKRKPKFDEAANLPFEDDELDRNSVKHD